MVVVRPDAPLLVVKVPSVPSDPGQGVIAALDEAADQLGLPARDLLSATSLFVHGTTVGTNTLLERKGAKVGLLTSAGFRDSLEIRRGFRTDPWDHRAAFSEVLVPRYLRLPVSGRLDRSGNETTPIAVEDVKRATEQFTAEGVESIAICLYNSYLSDIHEDEVAQIAAENWDGDWISGSSRLAPTIGEYERSSTVVLNAYIAPRTVRYLKQLDEKLTELGLPIPVLLIQNNGGAISIRQIDDQPATLLLSGPAAGVGALNYYSAATDIDNLISMEIGGTSCDVILMSNGHAATTEHLIIDGYHLAMPSIDVHTVGAGGGTIAGVDDAGMMYVGPQGAGARPGPACYGLGGEDPTITDAHLVLGRLSSDTYAGGSMAIDPDLAVASIARKLAKPLKMSIENAAIGVMRLMDQKLLHAVQQISVERGHDPSRFTLVAGGGAGALHATAVARLLGCRQVHVPRLAGAFCAVGMLNSDVRHEYFRVYFAPLDGADLKEIGQQLEKLRKQAEKMLNVEGFSKADMRFHPGCNLRYRGQQWDVQVMAESTTFDPAQIKANFEIEHKRLFGHIQPDGVIEFTKLRMVATGLVKTYPDPKFDDRKTEATPDEIRSIWIDAKNGWVDTPVYDGAQLGAGAQFEGPALINEKTTTILIGAGDRFSVERTGDYMIRLATNDGKQ